MSRCKISRRKRSLHAQRAEGSAAREANTTTLDDAGDKKPEARSRTENCLRAGDLKPADRVNMIVMDDPSVAKTPES